MHHRDPFFDVTEGQATGWQLGGRPSRVLYYTLRPDRRADVARRRLARASQPSDELAAARARLARLTSTGR
jgi:hypothetical protein